MRWPIVRDRGGRALRVGPGTVLRSSTADSLSLRIDVSGTGRSLLIGAGDGGLDVVPLAEPGKARQLGMHYNLFDVALSPDGRWAVAASYFRADVSIWDVARGTLVHRLPQVEGYGGATFSPDGRMLITADRICYRFWEVASWKLKATVPRGPRSVSGQVALPRDGRLLVVGQDRNRIDLYDAITLRRLAKLEIPGPAGLSGVSLSPDGTRLAATTDANVIALWNLRRLREELAALDLDWEMPPYPAAGPAEEPVEPLTAKVLPANTSPR
jgi:WD40 repeat protein